MTRFLDLNRRLSRRVDQIFPYPLAVSFWQIYPEKCAVLAETAEPGKIVDIGAGRETPYAALLSEPPDELIGIDLQSEDLDANEALTRRVTCDIMEAGIPMEARNASLITSRMVLEHIPDLDRLAGAVHDALAPGGRTIHLFASRYSAFAILNSLLSDSVSRRILFALKPESVNAGGFPAYYDKTNARAAESVFRRAGLIDVELTVSYQTSYYFDFFVPLFILVRLWEVALHRLGLENLASYVLLVARRPAGSSQEESW